MTKIAKQSKNEVYEQVAATLSTAVEQLKALWGTDHEPANQQGVVAPRARGTADVSTQARAAVAAVAVVQPTLRDRVQAQLQSAAMGTVGVAKAVREPPIKVSTVIREAARRGEVANIGTADMPVWVWRIGDETSAAELTTAVRRLISERPMTTRELSHATGARFTRVGGAIVAIQRSGDRILDLGTGTAGRWFLITEQARDARLSPKPSPTKE